MQSEIEGKNYVVTGASRGIGRAVCVELSRQKANVILVARNEDGMRETISRMEYGNHAAVGFDFINLEGIGGLMEDIYRQYGNVDGIIYSAGTGNNTTLQKSTFEVLHNVMLVNFYAFVELVRCVMGCKPQKYPMSIVALSSVASTINYPYYTAYSASKAALEAAIRCLSTELIRKNVVINAVRPANVDTEMTRNILYEDMNEHIKETGYQPLGLIKPEDVAKLTAYLLSDAARSITGMCIPINGGARL